MVCQPHSSAHVRASANSPYADGNVALSSLPGSAASPRHRAHTATSSRDQTGGLGPLMPSLDGSWHSMIDPSWKEDGWIRGPRGELYLWIPPEYRTNLCCQLPGMTTATMGTMRHPVRLDLSRFAHGTQWTKCWRSDGRHGEFFRSSMLSRADIPRDCLGASR